MKKFLLLASLFLIAPSFVHAQNMTFDDGTTWNCDENFAPVPLRYGYQYQFYDTFNNPTSNATYMNTYEVRYKDSTYMRAGQNWPGKWGVYWTNQVRNNGYSVPANSSMQVLSNFTNDWAILNHPAVRTGNDFTIGYKIGYDYSNNYPDASDDVSHTECQPYYITWCWDGIVDAGNGEQCDLWAQNGQVGSACSATCTTNVGPACVAGTLTGPQPAAVTAVTPGLCPAGQAVGGFASLAVGATTNYTWSCNGSAVGGACSASFTPVGPACVPGTTVGAQPAAITAASVGLCPAGQAVGGFASLAVGSTTNYTWSCNGSAVGGACSASFSAGGGWGLTCTPGNFVRDGGWVVPAQITAATAGLCPVGEVVGNFTDTTNGLNHAYSWSCNSIGAGLACTAHYNGPGGGGWGGGGGGWGGSICAIGNIAWGQGIALGLNTPGLCVSGVTPSNLQTSASNGTIVYSWACNGVSGCMSTYAPSSITVAGSSSYCGNGAVERPNSVWVYEDCDSTASWCDSSCHIASTNPGSASPGKLTITTPGSSSLDIATYQLIIGNAVPVFSANDVVAFETNSPMYLNGKTATITNNSHLFNGSSVSKSITGGVGWVLRMNGVNHKTYDGSGNLLTWTITYDQNSYPNSIRLFEGSELQGLKGDTSGVVGDYEDTITTNPLYRSQGLYASLQYLESPFRIRVSKPIIGNVAGGSAFIGSALGNSVDTVVWTFFNNLRSGNFTTSTVNTSSSYALSSATNSVSDDAGLSQAIASGSTNEEGSILRSSTGLLANNTTVSIASEFEIDSKSTKLGDAANIRVFKDADVSIDGNLSLAWVKTVIIENGNLIINKDIAYANKTSSFAWIVKNGNIIIADTVKNIAWVYVTLAGSIASNGVSTPNRLTVEGSLYGNTTDLVNNRSYVRGQTGYSALNVWVVVNYSNRAIMYPPPFLSRFLDQYSLQRVSR